MLREYLEWNSTPVLAFCGLFKRIYVEMNALC